LSEKFDSNLIINIKVSYAVIAVLSMAHLGAGLSAALVPLPWPTRIVLWLALAVNLVRALRRHGLRTDHRAVTGLEMGAGGLCAVRRAGTDSWQEGEVVRAVVHPWGVLLAVRFAGRRRPEPLLVPADAVPAEPFRRLRARLRLETRAA